MSRLSRDEVSKHLAKHYSKKFNGKVWAGFDESKRAYYIRGEGLPAHPDLHHLYPNGWGLLDYVPPKQARKIAEGAMFDEKREKPTSAVGVVGCLLEHLERGGHEEPPGGGGPENCQVCADIESAHDFLRKHKA